MRKRIVLFIVVLIQSCVALKSDKSQEIRSGKINYQLRDVISEKDALEANIAVRIGLEEYITKDMDSLERAEVLNSESHNSMKALPKNDTINFEFRIMDDYYSESLFNNRGEPISKIKYTDRDSLYQCIKSIMDIDESCTRKSEVIYEDESGFKFQFKRENTKEICGYNCFKVIAVKHNDNFANENFVMFVTEEIKLNYHPFIKLRSFNNKFFVMELTRYFGDQSGVSKQFKVTNVDLVDKSN